MSADEFYRLSDVTKDFFKQLSKERKEGQIRYGVKQIRNPIRKDTH